MTRITIDDTPCLIGPRDPRANRAFSGSLMIAEVHVWDRLDAEPDFGFDDACGAHGFCIVFEEDERAGMVQHTRDFFA